MKNYELTYDQKIVMYSCGFSSGALVLRRWIVGVDGFDSCTSVWLLYSVYVIWLWRVFVSCRYEDGKIVFVLYVNDRF